MKRGFYVFVALGLVVRADAQPTAPATPMPFGVASDDVALALDTNPSLLAFVPRYSLFAGHVRGGDERVDTIGTNVVGALAFGRFGFGLGFDRLDSPLVGRGRFSLGAAYAPSRMFALGLAMRLVGTNGALDGTRGLDLAATIRPSSRFSIAVTASDVLGPLGLDGTRSVDLDTRFGAFVAFRPLGDEAFTAEIGMTASTSGILAARLFSAIGFSDMGRAFFVGRLDDLRDEASASLLAGLELRLDGLSLGSALVADDAGSMSALAFASLEGRVPGGLVERERLLRVDLDRNVSPRDMVRHLLAFDRARLDPDVVGAVVSLRGSGIGLADAQELRYAIALLARDGRWVTCMLESPTGAELYACGTATETYVDEAGTVRLVGPSVDIVTFGGLLEELGVRAEFIRIGAYKSAPERFTNREPSAESIAQTTRFVDDAYERMVADLASDLEVERSVIREAIDRGPLLPREAETVGLVDGSLDRADLDGALERLHGRSLPLVRDEAPVTRGFGDAPRVAVVVISGTLVDRSNIELPLLGTRASGADTLVATLEALRRDHSIGAVVLRIDSPGGSATASDRIWRAARRLAEAKPVIASMGGVAASGGYYVATAARTIYADPSTLTGSIGIYFGKADVATLASRFGVGIESVERGEHAGATSIYRPFDDAERARLEELVQAGYELFLRRVSEGRGRTVESLDGLCEGRIWSGDAARENGLVDRLGGLVAAIAHARSEAGMAADAGVVVLPARHAGIVDRVIGSLVGSAGVGIRARGLSWMVYGGMDGLMALGPIDEGVR